MIRALLWKELRMQRPVLFAGAAFAALGPLLVLAMLSTDDRYGYWYVVRVLPTALAATWPFLGVAAGAITFATEAEDGTARFLLSRPVSRARVWCVKVGAAAATIAATGLLSLLALRLVAGFVGSPPADFVVWSGYSDWTMFVSSTVLGLGLLFFASGVLCSTVVTRPLTAAAAAVAVGLAVLSIAFILWSVTGLTPHLEPQWLGVEVILLSAVLIAASLLAFVWPEQFGRGAAPSATGRAGVASAAILLLLAVVMPLAFAALTPGVDEVAVVPGSVAYTQESVVMAMRDGTGTTQNWLLMTDGSGARPVTGRHTMAPQWPRGRTLIAYYSQRGAIGNAGSRLDLRMTDTHGLLSWTVFRGMPGFRELFFYAPGRNGSVAFTNGSEIIVARMNGYGHESIGTTGTRLEDATLLRLTENRFGSRRSRALLMASGELDVATATLRAAGAVFLYEIDTGSVRDLMPLAAGSVLPAPLRNPAPHAASARAGETWRQWLIPLLAVEPVEGGAAGARLVRLEPANGKVEVVREIETAWTNDAERAEFSRCAVVESANARRWQTEERPRRSFQEEQVLFGDCSAETRAEFGAGAVRLVGTRTGNVVSWPLPLDWEGTVQRIYLAGRQRTVLLDIRGTTPADSYAMTLDLDRNARTYPGWTPLGWTTIDYFLLQRERDGEVTFAAGDARTGEIYDLFPENELREVLEQRRLEELARVAAAAGR